MVAALEQVLRLRGIAVEVFSEVIIGTKMSVAQKLMKVETQHSSRYFTISDRYNNIFFITNDHRGDALLGVIADQKKTDGDQSAGFGWLHPTAGYEVL